MSDVGRQEETSRSAGRKPSRHHRGHRLRQDHGALLIVAAQCSSSSPPISSSMSSTASVRPDHQGSRHVAAVVHGGWFDVSGAAPCPLQVLAQWARGTTHQHHSFGGRDRSALHQGHAEASGSRVKFHAAGSHSWAGSDRSVFLLGTTASFRVKERAPGGGSSRFAAPVRLFRCVQRVEYNARQFGHSGNLPVPPARGA